MIDVRALAEQAGLKFAANHWDDLPASREGFTRFARLVLQSAAARCIQVMKECDADSLEEATPYRLCAAAIRRLAPEEGKP